MTVASIGHAIRFERLDDDSPSWEMIGEVVDPGSISRTRDTVDATHTLSPNRFREFISGLRDAGEFTPVIAIEPNGESYQKLKADFESDSAATYRFIFPNANQTSWQFSAFLTSWQDAAPLDDRMTASLTFKVTGQPTLSNLA